ncbi:unnamed protein product [Brassica oleracea]
MRKPNHLSPAFDLYFSSDVADTTSHSDIAKQPLLYAEYQVSSWRKT